MNDATNAAALGAAGSIAANMVGNAGNRREQKRANQYNLDQWHRQNAYNDPKRQMERLQNAGLNPNLIYGTSPTSAVGNAGAVAPAKAADFSADNPLEHLSTYANFGVQQAQTDNLRAQSEVITQDAILKAAQTASTAAGTARSKFDLGLAQELKNTSVDAAKQNLKQLEQRTIETQINNEIKDATKADLIKKLHYEAANAAKILQGSELTNELRRLEINLNKLGVQKSDNLFFRILGQFMDPKLIDAAKDRIKNFQN